MRRNLEIRKSWRTATEVKQEETEETEREGAKGGGQMANGKWQMANGGGQVANGKWQSARSEGKSKSKSKRKSRSKNYVEPS
jgi:hypothetical protein